MSCYLLFKEPMKYLVPRGSGRPKFTPFDMVSLFRAFSYDVTAAILVFQNKETAAILVYQAIPPGIKLYFSAKIVFCFSKPI